MVNARSPRRLVLGSASPRRREMSRRSACPSSCAPPRSTRPRAPARRPSAYLERIVEAKLEAVRARTPARRCRRRARRRHGRRAPGGEILGKPRDDDEARAMIERLAGRDARREHALRLASGAAGAGPPWHARDRHDAGHVPRARCAARSPPTSPTGEGRDKAGAYAMQGAAAGVRRAHRGQLHERRRPAALRGRRRRCASCGWLGTSG